MDWVGVVPGSGANSTGTGSYAAVGTFNPSIEMYVNVYAIESENRRTKKEIHSQLCMDIRIDQFSWDLDLDKPVEPTAVLGGFVSDGEGVATETAEDEDGSISKKKKKKSKKKKKKKNMLASAAVPQLKPDSHKDAVMCLGASPYQRNVLASGSADHTVKLWDVTTLKCELTLTQHTDKVQALAWNPSSSEPTVLATGGFDRRLCEWQTVWFCFFFSRGRPPGRWPRNPFRC